MSAIIPTSTASTGPTRNFLEIMQQEGVNLSQVGVSSGVAPAGIDSIFDDSHNSTIPKDGIRNPFDALPGNVTSDSSSSASSEDGSSSGGSHANSGPAPAPVAASSTAETHKNANIIAERMAAASAARNAAQSR